MNPVGARSDLVEPPEGTPCELLIIDDCEEDRILYARLLEQGEGARYSILEAGLGREGLELCRSRRPDCVLLDFDLPDVNGLEVLRELSGDEETGTPVPVIMLTGGGHRGVEGDAIAAGAQDYIPKDQIDFALLHRTIRHAIGRHRKTMQARGLGKELREAREDVERLLYVVSHDLREPLRLVRSFLQLLAHRNEGRLDADSVKFLASAVEAAEWLERLLDDLLRYARAGRGPLELALTPIGEIVDVALAKLEASPVEAEVVVNRGELPTVMVDPARLGLVFQSLIENAIKFRRGETPRVDIRAGLEGTQWTISVVDNGIGIDMRFSERIFEVFQRLHSRSEYEGTGIGLPICRKIVEAHGGRIWVEAVAGRGSSFRFTLPTRK